MKFSESDKRRFWKNVNKDGPIPSHVPHVGQCWEWTGTIGRFGYGQIWIDGGTRRAHRVSWAMTSTESPSGKDVLHKCDNRKCVNPSHLFLGDNAINAQDREAKGRGTDNRGERSGQAKLTTKEVLEIRSNCGKYSKEQIAKAYGIATINVYHLTWGISWKHIPIEPDGKYFSGLERRMENNGFRQGRKKTALMVRVWRFDDAPVKYQAFAQATGAKWLAIVPEAMGNIEWLDSEEFGLKIGEKFHLPNGLILCIGYPKYL